MKKFSLLFVLLSLSGTSQITKIADFAFRPEVVLNGKALFMGIDPTHGKELWISDGTEAGTHVLKDIIPGTIGSIPYSFLKVGNVAYFQTDNNQIWRTDGTNVGTYLVMWNPDIVRPFPMFEQNGWIYFMERESGSSRFLWRMNGNPNSEVMVTPKSTFTDTTGYIRLNGTDFLFNGRTASGGWAIWRSNGIVNQSMIDLTTTTALSSYTQLNSAKNIDGKIYFSPITETYGWEPWTTDGTASGTQLLKDIYVSNYYFDNSAASNFTKMGGQIFFVAKDNMHGLELWKTDGTGAGTMMVKEICPGNNNSGSQPEILFEYNSLLYFQQHDGTSNQLYKTDGTEAGTIKLTNLDYFWAGYRPLVKDGKLFFTAYTLQYGEEPYFIDLETLQITMIADINPGIGSSSSAEFFELNGNVFFSGTIDGTIYGDRTFRINPSVLSVSSEKKSDIKIHPNPVSDILNLSEKADKIEITDQNGRLLKTQNSCKSVDVKNLASGIYYLKIINGQKKEIKKFIKK